jgi:SIR2-like domain
MSLREADWEELLYSIDEQQCTPFIGAGASSDWLPLGYKISTEMAQEYDYPLSDGDQLDKVSQFVAIEQGDMVPKNFIVRRLKKTIPPDFSKDEYRNTPYAILADLRLPIYITTNYDEFMENALMRRGRNPDSEYCRWNNFLRKQTDIHSVFDNTEYRPSQKNPLVYHLHGHIHNPRSMVLTETDYLDFLINLSKEEDILPHHINRALNSSSLLFIGYSLRDINFRFIFRSLMHLLGEGLGSGLQFPSIAVQLPSGFTNEKKEQALRYLEEYTKNMFKVRVYWGDVNKFATDLRNHWEPWKKC